MTRVAASALTLSILALAACAHDAPTERGLVTLDIRADVAEGAGRPMTVAMSQEVFQTMSGTYLGDPDGHGTATLSINVGREELCWELVVADIALPATAAHIHKAAAGVQGPPVIWLTSPDASGRSAGCATAARDLLRDILVEPSGYYVNVHNAQHAPGAIRSQLDRTP